MFPALQHRNFPCSCVSSRLVLRRFLQTAAILWHVSTSPPTIGGLARPRRARPRRAGDCVFLPERRGGRRARPPPPHALTQSVMACLALILAALTFRGLSSLWPIYVLAACSSAAGAFDLPARQSLVPNLVPREHLPNAITLNTIMVQIASVAGPALGGVIATGGVAWVYAINARRF